MSGAHACMYMCLHVHSVTMWNPRLMSASSSICHSPLDFEVQSLIEPGAQQFNWSSMTVPSRVSYFYLLRVGITASHWLLYVSWRPRLWSFCSVVSTHSLSCPPALYPAAFTNHLKTVFQWLYRYTQKGTFGVAVYMLSLYEDKS